VSVREGHGELSYNLYTGMHSAVCCICESAAKIMNEQIASRFEYLPALTPRLPPYLYPVPSSPVVSAVDDLFVLLGGRVSCILLSLEKLTDRVRATSDRSDANVSRTS